MHWTRRQAIALLAGTLPAWRALRSFAAAGICVLDVERAADVRFTTKSHSLFAIFMGWPRDRRAVIPSLGTGQPNVAGRVRSVELLGHPGTLEWKQEPAGLTVRLPAEAPSQIACALRIEGLEIA
jgi:hypothetical protein